MNGRIGVVLLAVVVSIGWAPSIEAAPADYGLDLGSDGSYGAITVGAGEAIELTLPDDGIFHATTVTIAEGGVLTFVKNPWNTPAYILATGAIQIDGTIDVSGHENAYCTNTSNVSGGAGGPGGFQGGRGVSTGYSHEIGHGPRSLGGPYLTPLIGGSGGEGDTERGGGGGGGAILVASNTTVTLGATGLIDATGGDACQGGYGHYPYGGNGGAVRIVSAVFAGSGTIDVRGGDGKSPSGSAVPGGIIRLDTIDGDGLTCTKHGTFYLGAHLKPFLDTPPQLDILSVGQQSIAPGASPSVTLLFTTGEPNVQAVTVKASNFSGDTVTVNVRLISLLGGIYETWCYQGWCYRIDYDLVIDLDDNGEGQGAVDADFPLNVPTRVMVWTK